MRYRNLRLALASGALALVCAGCASTPESEDVTIYVNSDTGLYSTDANASPEAKAIVDMMNKTLPPKEPAAALSDAEILKADDAGNLTHVQSGLMCPAEWTGFSRTDAHIYESDGQNVGCTYLQGDSLMSFYAYRNGGTVADEVDLVMEQVVKGRHPVHTPATIETFENAPPPGAFAYGVIGYTDSNGVAMKSGVLIKQISGWRMKLRFTYPASESSRDEAFIVASSMGQQDAIQSLAKANKPGSGNTI